MTTFYKITFTACLLGLVLALSSVASACPKSGRLNDYNCNQEVKFLFSGDSVVAGVRDESEAGGGYPMRLKSSIPEATIKAVATPGVSTESMVLALSRQFRRPGNTTLRKRSICADWVLLDIGRNDFWRGLTKEQTVRNLKRLVSIYRYYIARDCDGVAPIVSISTMIPTNRRYQRTYIAELNDALLRNNSMELPVHVRFDRMKKEHLSWDGLHPSAKGYNAMHKIVRSFIFNKVNKSIKRQRPDSDHDGIADFFETERYGTSSSEADSDNDGYSDGFEIFRGLSDPLDNMSTPLPTATPTPTPS